MINSYGEAQSRGISQSNKVRMFCVLKMVFLKKVTGNTSGEPKCHSKSLAYLYSS